MIDLGEKRLGFGLMRLPTTDGKNNIDEELLCHLVDCFLKKGFRYFDTAYPYHNGKSELMVRKYISTRYARDSFILADKIAPCFVKDQQDLERIFQEQLIKCGVEYFDVYLLHNLGVSFYEMAKEQKAFEFLRRKKEEGKVRYIGFSFHDTPELLDRILEENQKIDVVQIQLNYLDWENPAVRSRECLEIIRRHQKKAIIMEPVKGGSLANLPEEARNCFEQLGNASAASYALRFAAQQREVVMVLSGMNSMEQVVDNTTVMSKPIPLNPEEFKAIENVKDVLRTLDTIACTRCGYCMAGCVKQIAISNLFSIYNQWKMFGEVSFPDMHYNKNTSEQGRGKAGECIKCGKCEEICPQHLNIISLLEQVAEVFEHK